MMKELEQAIEVLTKLRVDAFKHNQDGLEKSLYELEQMIFKAQDSLQSKGKTKEEVLNEVLDYNHMPGMIQPASRLRDAIFQAMEEYAQSHANKDGWVKEHVKCATLCAGCNEDCKGREAYFTKPQP